MNDLLSTLSDLTHTSRSMSQWILLTLPGCVCLALKSTHAHTTAAAAKVKKANMYIVGKGFSPALR